MLPAVARLDEIPGISAELACSIIAETGLDMTRFPTAAHLVSWAGLSPRTIQSGPRTRHGKGQGNTYLRGYLGQAATGAAGTATFLGERYRPRRPPPRQAPKPRSPSPAPSWSSSGTCSPTPKPATPTSAPATTTSRTDKNRKARNHIRQLEALGYTVTLAQAA